MISFKSSHESWARWTGSEEDGWLEEEEEEDEPQVVKNTPSVVAGLNDHSSRNTPAKIESNFAWSDADTNRSRNILFPS